MLAYAVAVKPAESWYRMMIKESDERYSEAVESDQPDKVRALVDLRNDYAFKLLFGSKGNERILIEFLNVVLKLPRGKQIREVTFLNTEISKEYAKDKKSVLDILVKTNDGDYINVEIQLCNKYDMPARSLYYSARLISKEVQEGESYISLKQTITINLVNFEQFTNTDAYHTRFELYDSEAKVTLTDRLQVHFVELPKFLDQWKQGQLHPREDRLARWLLLLEASENETILSELEEIAMQQDPVLAEALDKWDEMSRDPDVRMAYEMRHKQLKDEAVGFKDVEIRGERRGEARGEARGKARMIQTMFINGATITQVSQFTGLTIEEIEHVQKTQIT